MVAAPSAVVVHHHKPHVSEFVRRFFHYGEGAQYVSEKHALPSQGRSEFMGTLRMADPWHFAYRCKRYMTMNGVPLRAATGFALLDIIRAVSFLAGYYHALRGPRAVRSTSAT